MTSEVQIQYNEVCNQSNSQSLTRVKLLASLVERPEFPDSPGKKKVIAFFHKPDTPLGI